MILAWLPASFKKLFPALDSFSHRFVDAKLGRIAICKGWLEMGNARWHLVILMLTVGTASGGIKFGVIHSTQTVDVNHFQSGAQTISLAGARGEWESAQIVVAINGPVAETGIAVEDLKSENSRIPQTALQIRKVEDFNGYADALVPCARVSLSSKPVVLWLTVKIPAETLIVSQP